MGERLTKIYTRTGDDGSTGLASGERVGKDCLLIQAQGDLDELNAHIASLRAHNTHQSINQLLVAIQHHLFNLGGELSAPECDLTHSSEILWLESWIDHFNQSLPPLEDFILPGDDICVAQCHVARTVCRRTERNLVQWSRDHDVRPELLQYINRLSDLLFVIGRVIEADNNQTTTLWEKNLALPQPE